MTMAADVDRDGGSRTGESSRATDGKSERVEELVRKWQDGDRKSGNILFTKYYSELLAFAHRLFPEPLRRRVDTVDVVQEACAAACESRAQFEYRDTSSFSRWLFTIVENKLWKRWQAERAREISEECAGWTRAFPSKPRSRHRASSIPSGKTR